MPERNGDPDIVGFLRSLERALSLRVTPSTALKLDQDIDGQQRFIKSC